VNLILRKLEKKNKINLIDLFRRLGVVNVNSANDHSTNNAEGLLRLLLERIQKNGLPIEEAFRHFDSDGDGIVSEEELLEGLEKLNIFENIPNWKLQIPVIVNKFDTNGDNSLNLKEFFGFLGITDYSPNTIQKMTKIFALSTDKGLSIVDIFTELDSDNTGVLTAENIKEGLSTLGIYIYLYLYNYLYSYLINIHITLCIYLVRNIW
jgi:Ca2+-binding EF-hand superfamily protein